MKLKLKENVARNHTCVGLELWVLIRCTKHSARMIILTDQLPWEPSRSFVSRFGIPAQLHGIRVELAGSLPPPLVPAALGNRPKVLSQQTFNSSPYMAAPKKGRSLILEFCRRSENR